MEKYKLGDMEQRFAEIIWKEAPVGARKLVQICENEFGWKRTTTYTMLKRLIDRGLFENSSGLVTALISPEDFQAARGEQFVNETFGGSLPQFFAAFTRRKKLSNEEIQELLRMIEEHKEP